MRHHTLTAGLLLSVLAAVPSGSLIAQQAAAAPPPSATRPGRDPHQPIDQAYTNKIHEYTTEPFFGSPLVNYLPASPSVPTPAAVLGGIAGAPTTLPYAEQVHAYMRLLAKSTPRVRVYSIGKSEEGREMIAVAVASESLLTHLDSNRAGLAKLADPRTIGMNDATAARIVATSTPVYYITGTIHSPESGAPTALMELAYRLAVDDSPYIRYIRDHLITLITPVVEVDGRDREVDVVHWHFAHPGETYPPLVYWGHYVAHDNNRDQMAMTLQLSRHVLDTYVQWKAQVIHDLHESGFYLYDVTETDGAYDAWFDPLLMNEWHMLAWNNVQEMTRLGMPGVYSHGTMDNWSPGYLESLAASHNGISRLYETMGNGGTPETKERTLPPSATSRTWWRQDPPLPRVQWSMRDNNNYEETGLLVSLNYFAHNRQKFLENFYEKSKRAILKARTEGPAAYVLPGDPPRPGAQVDLLRVLQLQHVEISRATAPFRVTVPARWASDHRPGDAADSTATSAPRQFPAGSYIIRMDQPYSRIADALLDYQYYSPDDPQRTPYDDTGWTFPELFATEAVRVTDTAVLHVPVQAVTGTLRAPGGVTGTGSVFLIDATGDNALVSLRYRFARVDFQTAEEPFRAAGRSFHRGAFIVRHVSASDLAAAAHDLGVEVYAVASAPSVPTHAARAARVAILHTWLGTQSEGWWRQAFDLLHIPYAYINVQDVALDTALNAKYDVILFPPGGGNGQSIIDGMPMWRNPLPWKKSPLTPNLGLLDHSDDIRPGLGWSGVANLQRFVARGGVLVTVENTAAFAANHGLARGVRDNEPSRRDVMGSVLRTRVVDDASPLLYGVPDDLAIYSASGESFSIQDVLGRGAFRRRERANADARATGRGTLDDPDVVQGRPALDSANRALPSPPVHPWQAPPVTVDALRSPINIIPPNQRPRVVLRFADHQDLLVSGLLDGGTDIAQRAAVVDVPTGKGHVILMANNPIYRGETIGSYFLVFNAMLNFDRLDAGRTLDPR